METLMFNIHGKVILTSQKISAMSTQSPHIKLVGLATEGGAEVGLGMLEQPTVSKEVTWFLQRKGLKVTKVGYTIVEEEDQQVKQIGTGSVQLPIWYTELQWILDTKLSQTKENFPI